MSNLSVGSEKTSLGFLFKLLEGQKTPRATNLVAPLHCVRNAELLLGIFVEPVFEKFHHDAQMAAEATRGQLSWSIGADARWQIESSGRGDAVAISCESSSESSIILFFVGHQRRVRSFGADDRRFCLVVAKRLGQKKKGVAWISHPFLYLQQNERS